MWGIEDNTSRNGPYAVMNEAPCGCRNWRRMARASVWVRWLLKPVEPLWLVEIVVITVKMIFNLFVSNRNLAAWRA